MVKANLLAQVFPMLAVDYQLSSAIYSQLVPYFFFNTFKRREISTGEQLDSYADVPTKFCRRLSCRIAIAMQEVLPICHHQEQEGVIL